METKKTIDVSDLRLKITAAVIDIRLGRIKYFDGSGAESLRNTLPHEPRRGDLMGFTLDYFFDSHPILYVGLQPVLTEMIERASTTNDRDVVLDDMISLMAVAVAFSGDRKIEGNNTE